MVEDIQYFNDAIINVNEISEKLTDKRKKNIVRFEIIYDNNSEDITGTGFLCKINYKNDKYFYALITCYHMIDDNYKEQFESLKFSYFKENKKIDRKINIKDGRIFYQNKNWDITII